MLLIPIIETMCYSANNNSITHGSCWFIFCNESDGKENNFFSFWYVNNSKLLGWEANVNGTWKFLVHYSHLLMLSNPLWLISSWERWQRENKNQRMNPGSTTGFYSNRENWSGWLRGGNIEQGAAYCGEGGDPKRRYPPERYTVLLAQYIPVEKVLSCTLLKGLRPSTLCF